MEKVDVSVGKNMKVCYRAHEGEEGSHWMEKDKRRDGKLHDMGLRERFWSSEARCGSKKRQESAFWGLGGKRFSCPRREAPRYGLWMRYVGKTPIGLGNYRKKGEPHLSEGNR